MSAKSTVNPEKSSAKTAKKVKAPKVEGAINPLATPRLSKITINVGIGTMTKSSKDYSEVVENVKLITGQQPVVTLSKKSISNFALRENMPVGVMVTLRGKRMHDFFAKLIHLVFPRIRDFRGMNPRSFDQHGNYTIGLREVLVFPEVSPDNVLKVHGMEITITTTAKSREEGYQLFAQHGFPFKKD